MSDFSDQIRTLANNLIKEVFGPEFIVTGAVLAFESTDLNGTYISSYGTGTGTSPDHALGIVNRTEEKIRNPDEVCDCGECDEDDV